MIELTTLLGAIVPVFAMMTAGLLIRRVNWLTEEADHSLFRVVMNLLMPCLILDTTLGNAAFNTPGNLILAPLIGGFTVLLGVVMAWFAGRWLTFSGAPARRTFAFCTGLHNYGFIALPLTLLLFNENTTGVLFLHNLGVEICVWTVLLLVLTGRYQAGAWKQFINGPFISILLALALNSVGVGDRLPKVLENTVHLLGQCAFPMGLVLIGATIADHLHDMRSSKGWGEMFVALVLRQAVMPVVILLLAKYLPVSHELKGVLVIEAAMPAATVPIVIARHFGGDAAMAVRIVVYSTAVSLITTPLWIRFGLKWVGL